MQTREDEIVKQLNEDSLIYLDDRFTYDWTDFQTIADNQHKITEIKKTIQSFEKIEGLSHTAKIILGQLAYKLGTYYLYAEFHPEWAMENFQIAERCLDVNTMDWLVNHSALCHIHLGNHHQSVLHYQSIISKHNDAEADEPERLSILAFSLWVRSLLEIQNNQMKSAVLSSRIATQLYEKINRFDDAYALFKLSHAIAMIHNRQEVGARLEFELLEEFWVKKSPLAEKKEIRNPHLPTFYHYYASFLEKEYPEKKALILNKYQLTEASLQGKDHHLVSLSSIKAKIHEFKNKLLYLSHAPHPLFNKSRKDKELILHHVDLDKPPLSR